MSVSGMVNGMAGRDRKTERARRQQGAIGVGVFNTTRTEHRLGGGGK